MNKETKNYNLAAIDYTRVIMAILVVVIHTKPFNSYNAVINYGVTHWLARIAVPFFFFCNGFFLFEKNCDKENVKSKAFVQLKKLLRMYLFWSAFYYGILACGYIILNTLTLDMILENLRIFLFDGFDVLWYLHAAIIAIFLLWFMFSRNMSWKAILTISAILYIIVLLGDTYYRIGRSLPIWDNVLIYRTGKSFLTLIENASNGLFLGLFHAALGAYFSCHKFPSKTTCFWGFIISMVIGCMEAAMIYFLNLHRYDGGSLYVFLPFATVFLFGFCLQIPVKNRQDTKNLRSFSSLIYLVHLLFSLLYTSANSVFKILHISTAPPEWLGNSLIKFFTILILSAISSLIIMRISKIKCFSWIKLFY